MKDKRLYRVPPGLYTIVESEEMKNMVIARLKKQGKDGCGLQMRYGKAIQCWLVDLCYLERMSRGHPKVESRLDCEVYKAVAEIMYPYVEDLVEELYAMT